MQIQSNQTLSWKWKAAIIGVVVLLIAVLLFIIKYQYDLLERQKAIESSVVEMKRLQDGVVRAQASYATKKDIEALAKDSGVDLKPIKDDLKKLDAEVKGVSFLLAKTPGVIMVNVPSTSTEPRSDKPLPLTAECPGGETVDCPNPDKYNYLVNEQRLELTEPLSNKTQLPFGKIGFRAWESKPWNVKIYPREYSVVTILSTNKDGRHFVHNKFMIDVDGKKYTMPISEAKFLEQYPEAEFRFDPNLYLGADLGLLVNPPARFEFVPNLQLALFSYGKTKVNPTWTFLGLGLGYATQEQTLGFMLSPVNYNVGDLLPLINNLYTGPSVMYDTNSNFGLLWGIRVGL